MPPLTPDLEYAQNALAMLSRVGVQLSPGLSNKEFETVEARFQFQFPPDLRILLEIALPIGGFPGVRSGEFLNWRLPDSQTVQQSIDWLWEGIAFDIENNVFWCDEWGTKPTDVVDALQIARCEFERLPRLIPVYGHRYLAAVPRQSGNPVFSIHQTDIIYYGQNLWDYFDQEFGDHPEDWYAGERYATFTRAEYQAIHRHIPFWSDLVS